MTVHFPVSHSILSENRLAEMCASEYGLTGPVVCQLIDPGVNDTYRLIVGEQTHILRVYRSGWRSVPEIDWELTLLLHLREQGVSVSVPLSAQDGRYRIELAAPEGPRQAVLFSFAPGKVLSYEPDEGYRYGQVVAAMHDAMDTFETDLPRFRLELDHLLERPLAGIRPFAERLGRWAYLSDFGDWLRARITEAESALTRGICHGDLHGHNVHQTADRALTIFDFDCGGPGYRSYDLTVFRWAVSRHGKNDEPWEAFLRGYRTVRPVAEADLALVPVFVALRTLWLIGLQVEQLSLRGTAYVQGFVDGGLRALQKWDETELRPV
ncbi:MAG: hypothetical protein K0R39_84 [Symbiobacteriaceae bacterium]|jgi:Ser/Thr protein kinase RdoA (MazF antagonist)|nr:hypothetical protein [Symbiobacteriaceae bacterium]